MTPLVEATARDREEGERIQRLWFDGQREHFERGLGEAREARASLEARVGGSVAGRFATLRAQFERATDASERERLRRALVESHLVELEDDRLRWAVESSATLLEAIRSEPPYAPVVMFSCFSPRGPRE